MKKFLLVVLVLVSIINAKPNLTTPAVAKLLSSAHPLWDTVEITSYLQNNGDSTAWSPLYPTKYSALTVLVDSLQIAGYHSIAYLLPGYFLTFKDTARIMKGPFALTTWTNPLFYFGEGGGQSVDNVLSWTYNFHPEITYDTIYIVKHDTITIHDTLRDTLKTGSQQILSKSFSNTKIDSKVYNILGQLVWRGNSEAGKIPSLSLSQGAYILIQDNKRKYLKVITK